MKRHADFVKALIFALIAFGIYEYKAEASECLRCDKPTLVVFDQVDKRG